MSYCIIWEFSVSKSQRTAFEAAYGPNGPWALLFRKSEGFLNVELLRSCDRPDIYFTIDRWISEQAFRDFRRDHSVEYEALDRRLDGLASRETRLDTFTEQP